MLIVVTLVPGSQKSNDGTFDLFPCRTVWRFLTFPFFHVGLLHLGFNMMAWVPLGG